MKFLIISIFFVSAFYSLKAQTFQNNVPLLQVNEIMYKCKWGSGNGLYIQNQQNNITDEQMYRGQTTNQSAIEEEYNPCGSGIYSLTTEGRKIIFNIAQSKFSESRITEIYNSDEVGFIINYYTDLSGKIKAVYFMLKGATAIKPQEIYAIEKALINIQIPVNFNECTWVSGNYVLGAVKVRLRGSY